VMVSKSSIFAHVRNEYNALCFGCQNVGRQIFIGKGAGELPTASAVLSDLGKIVSGNGNLSRGPLPHFAVAEPVRFCSSIENPRPYTFYAHFSLDPMKMQKIREIAESVAEFIEDTTVRGSGCSEVCVVTKPILHTDLYRVLDSVLSFEPKVNFRWLRVMEDAA
jgi:hypothetical protein